MIRYCTNLFDSLGPTSQVFEIIPKVFADQRGTFAEVLKATGQYPHEDYPLWLTDMSWVRQINRSTSKPGTIRGMHAQKGSSCQAKLVEAVTDVIFDVIIDARPASQTFGNSAVFRLDPVIQNKVFVPKGFLHGFIVPDSATSNAVFMYYCDNTYSHESEFCIRPDSVLPTIVQNLKSITKDDDHSFDELFKTFESPSSFIYSDKDRLGFTYDTWMNCVKEDYEANSRCWHLS